VHKELDVLGSRNSLAEFPAVMKCSRNADSGGRTISARVPLAEAGGMLRNWSESPRPTPRSSSKWMLEE